MGLDMYLRQKVFVGAKYEHRNVTGTIDIKVGDQKLNIDLKKVNEITLAVGYWRKANAIHAWFVKNVQNGKDECQESWVEYEKLIALRDLCVTVLATLDVEGLEPQGGFFFGSTEIDDYYFQDLKNTIEIINNLDPKGEYYYQASW